MFMSLERWNVYVIGDVIEILLIGRSDAAIIFRIFFDDIDGFELFEYSVCDVIGIDLVVVMMNVFVICIVV